MKGKGGASALLPEHLGDVGGEAVECVRARLLTARENLFRLVGAARGVGVNLI